MSIHSYCTLCAFFLDLDVSVEREVCPSLVQVAPATALCAVSLSDGGRVLSRLEESARAAAIAVDGSANAHTAQLHGSPNGHATATAVAATAGVSDEIKLESGDDDNELNCPGDADEVGRHIYIYMMSLLFVINS